MLARLLSLWGRRRAESVAGQKDRRVWVRFQCHLDVTCQPADAGEGEAIRAELRDISPGGVCLQVRSPVQEGDLLSLRLPFEANHAATFLACAVWVRDTPPEGRLVGCAFPTELTDEDLQRWGGRNPASPSPEMRSRSRRSCTCQGSYHKVRSPQSPPCEMEVLDVSADGLAMRTVAPARVGELLSVTFRDPQGTVLLTTLTSVVRISDEHGGEHLLGCTFIRELTEKELGFLS